MPLGLVVGDITEIKTDVIVNCTNEQLDMTGMVAKRIIDVAGPELEAECLAHRVDLPCKIGRGIRTKAYNLPCKAVIHVAAPNVDMEDAKHHLASCYKYAIAMARNNGYKSIAFPIISSGGHGFDMDEAVRIAIQRIYVELASADFDIYLVFHNEDDLKLAYVHFARFFGYQYTGSTSFPDPKHEIRSVLPRISPTVYAKLRDKNILYIDQLCSSCAANLFAVVGLNFSMFKELVFELNDKKLYLDDYSPSHYDSIYTYLAEKEKEWIEYCSQREFNDNLKQCNLGDISELEIPGRLITLLRKQNINTVKELISLTRDDLMAMKQFGVKGITQIEATLISHNLLLRGDRMYKCDKCGADYPDVIVNSPTHYCPKCEARLSRIRSIEQVKVTIQGPEYSSFERLSKGFILYANFKNISDELVKVKLKEFYIESNGRQVAKKYHLSGYYFDEESIMPSSVRTAAMIWDVESFADNKMKVGDTIFITLHLIQEKKNLMYKFVFGDDGIEIEDYFED